MSNKVGFVGVGAAGGNICDVAAASGYVTAAINTSQEDLDSLKVVQNKLRVGSNGGAGKDRKIAKDDLKQDHKKIINFVKEKFRSNEMVYVVFSAGGGTGSGMGPLIIDLLSRAVPEKVFGGIVVLPSKEESVVAQFNTIDCQNELIKIKAPYLIVDNEKAVNKYPNASRKRLYDSINQEIIYLFDSLLEERPASKFGNIDSKDTSKILSTPGYTFMDVAEINTKSNATIIEQVKTSLSNSLFVRFENDGVVRRAGFIFTVPEQMTAGLRTADILQEVGTPLEIFEGIYPTTREEETATVVTVLTGLNFPTTRMEEIAMIIEENKQKISTATSKQAVTIDTDWFAEARSESTVKTGTAPSTSGESEEDDFASLFDNY